MQISAITSATALICAIAESKCRGSMPYINRKHKKESPQYPAQIQESRKISVPILVGTDFA
jgi:hypothetical protein